jgi:hypothetical protein
VCGVGALPIPLCDGRGKSSHLVLCLNTPGEYDACANTRLVGMAVPDKEGGVVQAIHRDDALVHRAEVCGEHTNTPARLLEVA